VEVTREAAPQPMQRSCEARLLWSSNWRVFRKYLSSPRCPSVDLWTLKPHGPPPSTQPVVTSTCRALPLSQKLVHGNRRPGLRPLYRSTQMPCYGRTCRCSLACHEHVGAIRDAPFAGSIRAVIFFLAVRWKRSSHLARQASVRDVKHPQTRIV